MPSTESSKFRTRQSPSKSETKLSSGFITTMERSICIDVPSAFETKRWRKFSKLRRTFRTLDALVRYIRRILFASRELQCSHAECVLRGVGILSGEKPTARKDAHLGYQRCQSIKGGGP